QIHREAAKGAKIWLDFGGGATSVVAPQQNKKRLRGLRGFVVEVAFRDPSQLPFYLVRVFVPGDPRFEEILDLANLATQNLLLDNQRGRWRELVTQLLGNVRESGGGSERRQ